MTIEIIPHGSVTSPRGFLAGATFAAIKSHGAEKKDLGLLVSAADCSAAGVFTSNRVKAAPVLVCREHLALGHAQAVVANSGCANACTGAQGLDDARAMARMAAAKLHLPPESVLVGSTGKIGMQLPMERVEAGLRDLVVMPDGGHGFAQAIMTTDTRRKEIAVRVTGHHLPGDASSIAPAPTVDADPGAGGYVLAGCAKGAGMIHPNMATMLAFLTTDARVEPGFLHTALRHAAEHSFNMISIDGDMSTNDTLVILANGLSHGQTIQAGTAEAAHFQAALDYVCIDLARKIAADGEEATRLITVHVVGAASPADARRAARAVVGSNLTKCAVHGADPNWGRILCAVGYSGAEVDPNRLGCLLGDVQVVTGGTPTAFDAQAAHNALSGREVEITVDLHLGEHCATAWGCDMTEGYVTFNSEYTT